MQPKTLQGQRQLSGHFPAKDVKAFHVLAAEQDLDVRELMAMGMNMVFQSYGRPTRIEVKKRRQKNRNTTAEAN